MSDLQELIKKSEAAKRELDAENQKRALAEMLPTLQAQAEHERQREQANAAYARALEDTRRFLADQSPEIKAWQKRYSELCDELEAHIAEGQRLQNTMLDAARLLRDARNQKDAVNGSVNRDALFNNGFGDAWAEVGGTDEALNLLPVYLDPNGIQARVLKLMRFNPVSVWDIPRVLMGF